MMQKLQKIENKIRSTTGLVTKTNFNAKATEIDNKIPDITELIKNTHFDTRLRNNNKVTSNKAKVEAGK